MKINYIVIPLIVLAVAIIGGFFTSQGMDWYETINIPDWTPSGSVISSAWTIIFILSAISVILVWNKGRRNGYFWLTMAVFVINGFLNVFWSYLFFHNGLIGAAAWEAGLLGFTVLILIISNWRISKIASLLLAPYLLWVGFAVWLNYIIFTLN
jgi:translocator protein